MLSKSIGDYGKAELRALSSLGCGEGSPYNFILHFIFYESTHASGDRGGGKGREFQACFTPSTEPNVELHLTTMKS